MNFPSNIESTRQKLNAAMKQLDATFIQRTDVIHVMATAEVARANYIQIGEPGTGKTAIIECFIQHIEDGTFFEELCGSFCTEDKLFGPIDIQSFKAGSYKRVTKGRLADVTHGFCDEIMKTNDGTLNSLLGVMNERTYEGQLIPLRVLASATNWPEVKSRSEKVGAMWDRFHLRVEVKEVTGEAAEVALLEAADEVEAYEPAPGTKFTLVEMDEAHEWMRANVSIDKELLKALVDIKHRLQKSGIVNSSRRMARCKLLLKASAFIDGRDQVAIDDFNVLKHALWHDKEHIAVVESVIGTADQAALQKCIATIDASMSEYNRLKALSPQRRLEEAPRVTAHMHQTAVEVQKVLAAGGLMKNSRAKVAKSMAALKDKFQELSAEVKKAMSK